MRAEKSMSHAKSAKYAKEGTRREKANTMRLNVADELPRYEKTYGSVICSVARRLNRDIFLSGLGDLERAIASGRD